jgi:hypothetical protein
MTASGEARGMGTCHQCGAAITDAVRFRDTCPSCQAYLHCCLNCRLYSPSAHNHCLSPTTEYVGDVAGANFCDEFEFTSRPKPDDAGAAKRRFDQLFGG